MSSEGGYTSSAPSQLSIEPTSWTKEDRKHIEQKVSSDRKSNAKLHRDFSYSESCCIQVIRIRVVNPLQGLLKGYILFFLVKKRRDRRAYLEIPAKSANNLAREE